MRSHLSAFLAVLPSVPAASVPAPGLAVCRVILLVFAMSGAPAQATLMTFGDGAPLESDGYSEAGLGISATSEVLMQIRNWQQSETEIGEREVLDNDGASYDFSLVSGGVFDLLSIDVEDPCCSLSKFGTVDVVGSNGSAVTLNAQAFGTQSFGTTFLGISSFTIQYAPSSQLTFDNVNFRVIPEPRALVLIGSSFSGLICLRRRTKRRALVNDHVGNFLFPNRRRLPLSYSPFQR